MLAAHMLGMGSSQVLHVTDRTPAPPLMPLLEFIREHFPPVQSRRPLGEDAQRLTGAISTTIDAPDQRPDWWSTDHAGAPAQMGSSA